MIDAMGLGGSFLWRSMIANIRIAVNDRQRSKIANIRIAVNTMIATIRVKDRHHLEARGLGGSFLRRSRIANIRIANIRIANISIISYRSIAVVA